MLRPCVAAWLLLAADGCAEPASTRPSAGSAPQIELSAASTVAQAASASASASDRRKEQLHEELLEAIRREEADEVGPVGPPLVCKPACGPRERCQNRREGPKCFQTCSKYTSDSPNDGCPAGTYCESCADRMCPTCKGCIALCLPGAER